MGQKLFRIEQIHDVTVVRLSRNMADQIYAHQALKELALLVETECPSKLLIDLADIDLLHGSALGELSELDKRVASHDGELRICNLQPSVSKVFSITRIDQLLRIRDDEQSAFKD